MTRNQFNALSATTIPSNIHVNAQTILIARHYLLAVPQEVDPELKVRTAYLRTHKILSITLLENFSLIKF